MPEVSKEVSRVVRLGSVEVENCSKNLDRWVVARAVMGKLWYWGSWDSKEKAERVIADNQFDNGIVIDMEAARDEGNN